MQLSLFEHLRNFRNLNNLSNLNRLNTTTMMRKNLSFSSLGNNKRGGSSVVLLEHVLMSGVKLFKDPLINFNCSNKAKNKSFQIIRNPGEWLKKIKEDVSKKKQIDLTVLYLLLYLLLKHFLVPLKNSFQIQSISSSNLQKKSIKISIE